VAPGELEVAGEEVHKGAEAEDAPLPAGAGTGLGGGPEGAAAGVVGGAEEAPVVVSQGALAKIDQLLRGSLTAVPQAMQGASLLHGAMLWEMGIVKMLYTMLITPKEEDRRMVPDAAICPLGEVLNEFFYLAGGTFQISGMRSCLAQRLDAAGFGRLYASLIYNTDIILPGSNKHGSKNRALIKMFESCKVIDALNPKNLLPSIIASCFWAKHVMNDSVSIEQASENILAFNEAAGSIVPGADPAVPAVSTSVAGAGACAGGTLGGELVSTEYDLRALEAEVIARILELYQCNIPNPTFQGHAIIKPLPGRESIRFFQDCVENSIRTLFRAAFYDRENQKFVIPGDTSSSLYSPELRAYFEKYQTVDSQSGNNPRNDWAALCADRPGLCYESPQCALVPNFESLMTLIGFLVPGAIPKSCSCHTSSDLKAPHNTVCSKKILENFTTMPGHDLEIIKLNITDAGTGTIAFKSNKSGNKECHLLFVIGLHHAHCTLQLTKSLRANTLRQIHEPIFGGSDVFLQLPGNKDHVEPIIFGAASLAQKRSFLNGYICLYLLLQEDLNLKILSNTNSWQLWAFGEYGRSSCTAIHDINDRYILDKSCELGLSKNVEILLNREIDFDFSDEFGFKLIHQAITGGHTNVIMLLLKKGANINTALKLASGWGGHLEVVRFLVDLGVDINTPDVNGDTALIAACTRGHEEIVNLLLDLGVDINIPDGNGGTALIAACTRGHSEIVNLLLNKDANIYLVNFETYGPLICAAKNGHLKVVQQLLDRGADINSVVSNGDTALMLASATGRTDVVTLLLARWPHVAAQNSNGYTAFTLAAINGHFAVVKAFLDAGADINSVVSNGDTALMLASADGYLDVVTLLLARGANMAAKNSNGDTAFILAARAGHTEVVKLLLDAGAEYDAHLIKSYPHFSTWPEDLRARIDLAQAPSEAVHSDVP
jgi:ankyrin repeat protein